MVCGLEENRLGVTYLRLMHERVIAKVRVLGLKGRFCWYEKESGWHSQLEILNLGMQTLIQPGR
jgi:hypothetical protein